MKWAISFETVPFFSKREFFGTEGSSSAQRNPVNLSGLNPSGLPRDGLLGVYTNPSPHGLRHARYSSYNPPKNWANFKRLYTYKVVKALVGEGCGALREKPARLGVSFANYRAVSYI